MRRAVGRALPVLKRNGPILLPVEIVVLVVALAASSALELAVGVCAALAPALGGVYLNERAIRDAERDLVRRTYSEREAATEVAKLARRKILDNSLWTDVQALMDRWDPLANPFVLTRLGESWGVEAVIERGAVALGPESHWPDFSRELRSSAEELAGAVGPYSGRLAIDAGVALEAVIRAADIAAVMAAKASSVAYELRAQIPEVFYVERPTTQPKVDRVTRMRDLDAAAGGFIGALVQLVETVSALERIAEAS